MNISASNQSLENIIIRQEKEKKRPSFASVFEKINKRTSNMNRITPLNNKLTNEQLFRYYLKETDPKLRVSDDAFGEDETTLADLITNRSLNKSKVNQTLQTDDGDDDEGEDDASTQNVDEYLRIVEEINDEKQQDQSKSFSDSFFNLAGNYQKLKDAGTEASKQLENSIRPEDAVSLTDFMKNYDLEKSFNELDKSPFNKKEAVRRHGGDLLYEIAQNNAELGFVNDEFKDKINPMYEGSTDDFVSSIVGNTPKKTERLQNSLMEAGVDVREIENISPIKSARTIKAVQPTELVNQLVGAKTYSREFGPELLEADWKDKMYGNASELYYLMRGENPPWSDVGYYVRKEPLWRPTDRKGNWKDWAKAKYDKHDWYDDTVLDRASTAISSAVKGHAVRNRIREVKGIVNDLVDDVMGKTVTDAVKETAVVKRGRPAGSKNKVITPTNIKTRSSKDT